jgi:purine-binding chemotaxis protein CheW
MTTLLADPAAQTDELEIATFYVDDALLGIPIAQVEEINHHLELTPVPHVPPCVRGLMNLRGEVVTVVDLRVVLGLEPTAISRRTCNVVVRSRGEQVGILADRVGDVIRARRAEIEPPPANAAGADGRFLSGVCKLENELLSLLDVEQALAVPPKSNP